MNTLLIKSQGTLKNAPMNTPTFSSLSQTPLASFNAYTLEDTVPLGSPINLPFLFGGSAPEEQRVINYTGGVGAPVLKKEEDFVLSFDGKMGLMQMNPPLQVKKNFTVGLVFSVDSYKEASGTRIISVGSTYDDRNYITVKKEGVMVTSGSSSLFYVDESRKTGLQCLVVNFNGASSRIISSEGELLNFPLAEQVPEFSRFLRLGVSVASVTENAFEGSIAGFRIYEDSFTDQDLLDLYTELSTLYKG